MNWSFGASIATAMHRPNPAFWRIFAVTAVLLPMVLAVPQLRSLFHFALPPPVIVVIASLIGLLVLMMLAGSKAALHASGWLGARE